MIERTYGFELTSVSPFLFHHDNLEWADQINAERSEIKEHDKHLFKAADDRCPPHTWKGYLYSDGERVALPTECLQSALKGAGSRIELRGKTTFKSLTQSGILFDSLYAAFRADGREIAIAEVDAIEGTFPQQAEAAKRLGFRLFAKRAKIGASKHVRVRPRVEKWSVTGTFTVTEAAFTDALLEKLWSIAGVYLGLGDWRPGAKQSPGPFGRFRPALAPVKQTRRG